MPDGSFGSCLEPTQMSSGVGPKIRFFFFFKPPIDMKPLQTYLSPKIALDILLDRWAEYDPTGTQINLDN